MSMKSHILAALHEQLDRWEALLAGLSAEQITAPRFDDGWSIQDVIAHLWAWQQISAVRMEAAALEREPEFPAWLAGLNGDWEENAYQTNTRIYAEYHALPWADFHQDWKSGYLRLLALAEAVSEKDLLDASRYP